ncbi:hypothetical protein MHBO_000680 [Bonamia ostreae]|uniref:USP domain-containing protein n=1 Tax=Bonamia ostreae TaxID=126728 RepID=A0ABV2AGF3_9EUKA
MPSDDLALKMKNLKIESGENLTLEKCLEHFFAAETIEGPLSICDQCRGEDLKVRKWSRLLDSPDALAIHLKRFRNRNGELRKNEKNVAFSAELDLSRYFSERVKEKSGAQYKLVSLVKHSGSLKSGHYIAFVQDRGSENGDWYCFNDSKVKVVSRSKVFKEEAYLLFYEKLNFK